MIFNSKDKYYPEIVVHHFCNVRKKGNWFHRVKPWEIDLVKQKMSAYNDIFDKYEELKKQPNFPKQKNQKKAKFAFFFCFVFYKKCKINIISLKKTTFYYKIKINFYFINIFHEACYFQLLASLQNKFSKLCLTKNALCLELYLSIKSVRGTAPMTTQQPAKCKVLKADSMGTNNLEFLSHQTMGFFI